MYARIKKFVVKSKKYKKKKFQKLKIIFLITLHNFLESWITGLELCPLNGACALLLYISPCHNAFHAFVFCSCVTYFADEEFQFQLEILKTLNVSLLCILLMFLNCNSHFLICLQLMFKSWNMHQIVPSTCTSDKLQSILKNLHKPNLKFQISVFLNDFVE